MLSEVWLGFKGVLKKNLSVTVKFYVNGLVNFSRHVLLTMFPKKVGF